MVAYLLGRFDLIGNKPFQLDTRPFSIQPYTTFEHSSLVINEKQSPKTR